MKRNIHNCYTFDQKAKYILPPKTQTAERSFIGVKFAHFSMIACDLFLSPVHHLLRLPLWLCYIGVG